MDITAVKVDNLMKTVEKLQMQIDAICKKYGVQLEYKPDCYEANDAPQENEEGEM